MFEHVRTFKLHLKRVHATCLMDYVIKHDYNGLYPLCACGCGERVTWRNDAYFQRLVLGHYTNELREQVSARRLGAKASETTRRRQSDALYNFYASVEGQAVVASRAQKLREWTQTDEGKQSAIDRGQRLREFNATPEGKAIRERAGKKFSELRRTSPELWPIVRLSRETRTCPICDNEFELTVTPKKKLPRVCCSRSCAAVNRTQPRFPQQCLGCNTVMMLTQRLLGVRQFCNRACARGSELFREAMSASMVEQHLTGKRNVASLNHVCGFFMSAKCDAPVWYRSSYELRYIEVLNADDAVIGFLSEPISIPYVFEGRHRHYIPDFITFDVDGKMTLVEVKPKKLVSLPVNIAKFVAAQEWCASNNVQFAVMTEIELDIR